MIPDMTLARLPKHWSIATPAGVSVIAPMHYLHFVIVIEDSLGYGVCCIGVAAYFVCVIGFLITIAADIEGGHRWVWEIMRHNTS